MKIKKLIAIILVMTSVLLTACGKEADKADKTDKKKTTKEEKEEKTTKADEAQDENTDEDSDEPPLVDDVVSLLHLNKDYKSVNYMDSKTYEFYMDYVDEKMILSEEDANKFPALAKTLEKELNNRNDTYQSEIDSLIDIYNEDKEYGLGLGYSTKSNLSVERADSVVLSIRESSSEYSGGAHGMYGSYGYNYDTQTGKVLKFSDVVADPAGFLNLANDKIQKAYSDEYESPASLDEFLEDYDTSIIWTIDYQGVKVYFNPYTLGSYALGMVETEIYFSEAKELFNPKYFDIPNSYVMELKVGENSSLDINNDGEIEDVLINAKYDEEYDYVIGADLEISGETFSFYNEPEHCFFVSNNGKNSILVFSSAEGGYKEISYIDLSNMTMDYDNNTSGYLAMFNFFSKDEGDRSEYDYTEAVFTDPDKVYLSEYIQYLGTMTGKDYYRMGEDSRLVPYTGIYNISMNNILTANMDVECEQVDLDGNVLGKTVIKEGTRLVVRRGDGQTFADLIEVPKDADIDEQEYYIWLNSELNLEDVDVIYRVRGELGEYGSQAMINGKEEYLVFNNILYAD